MQVTRYSVIMGCGTLTFILSVGVIIYLTNCLPKNVVNVFVSLSLGILFLATSTIILYFRQQIVSMQVEWHSHVYKNQDKWRYPFLRWRIPLFLRYLGIHSYAQFAMYQNMLMAILLLACGLFMFGIYIKILVVR